MEMLKDITNIVYDETKYKPCRTNKYQVWVCKPTVGTIVFDLLCCQDVIKQISESFTFPSESSKILFGRYGFVNSSIFVKMLEAYGQTLRDVKNFIYKINTSNEYVICRPTGDITIVKYSYLQKNFQLLDGTEFVDIDEKVILKHSRKCNNGFIMDWIRGRHKFNTEYMALQIPQHIKGYFQTPSGGILGVNCDNGMYQGNGDMVVCDRKNDKPVFQSICVMKGAIFRDTFDNRGWGNSVGAPIDFVNVPKPPSLVKNVAEKFNTQTSTATDTAKSTRKGICLKELSKEQIPVAFIQAYCSKGSIGKYKEAITYYDLSKDRTFISLVSYLTVIMDDCTDEVWDFRFEGVVPRVTKSTYEVLLSGTYKNSLSSNDVEFRFKLKKSEPTDRKSEIQFGARGTNTALKKLASFEEIRPCLYKAILGGEIAEYMDESGNSKLLTK